MLHQLQVACNSNKRRGYSLMPDWWSEYARGVSNADSAPGIRRSRRLTHRRARLA